MRNFFRVLSWTAVLGTTVFLSGCHSLYLKGKTPDGSPVYLGTLPLENSDAYRGYLKTPRSEQDKILFLIRRIPEAKNLEYYRDGTLYSWQKVYDAGMWLFKNKYEVGQNARQFLQTTMWRSESTGAPNLIRYPDGTLQVGYFVLLNELDLLENISAQ